MILVDDAPLAAPLIFNEMLAEFGEGVFDFDWDTETEMPDPWLLGGEDPLRAQIRILSGRPDVTAWTMGAGRQLAARLSVEETELLPTVSATDDSDATEDSVTVCAEGDEGPSTL